MHQKTYDLHTMNFSIFLTYIYSIFLFACNARTRVANLVPRPDQILKFSCSIDSCISIGKPASITFSIANSLDEEICINAWALVPDKILYNNSVVQPYWLVEQSSPPIKQYIIVKGKSIKYVTYRTKFFTRYILKPGIDYELECRYYGEQNIKNKLFPVYSRGHIISKIKIATCN